MKKVIAVIVAAMVATPVVSGPLKSLTEIQEIVDSGRYQHYSGTKTEFRTPQFPWILGDHIEVGQVAPRIINPIALLNAAKKEQVVKVSGPSDFCYPIYQEIAEQNKVSCDALMNHLEDSIPEFNPATDVELVMVDILPDTMAAVEKLTSSSDDDSQSSSPAFVPAEKPFAADSDQRDVDALENTIGEDRFEALKEQLCRIRGC